MRHIKNWKALALSFGLAMAMLSPLTADAQLDNSHGLFNSNYQDEFFSDYGLMRGDIYVELSPGSGGIFNNDFGAPLGSGFAVLLVAGAGYALLKRKEEQQ